MSVSGLTSAESLVQHRDVWEAILRRLRAGDMPPAGHSATRGRGADRCDDRVTSSARSSGPMPPLQPDPGRMTAHRLNRNEYTNTIRDLLGVRFRAERDFPVDDSADGFDNIGDVLTVSPLLMERYMSAAERIAGWAICRPTIFQPSRWRSAISRARQRIRRLDRSTIEAEHRVEFAGEYIVRFGFPGERRRSKGSTPRR